MCLNKKNGYSGCSVINGCCRLKFAKALNSKLPLKSFEHGNGNITTSQYNTGVINSIDINTAGFAIELAGK